MGTTHGARQGDKLVNYLTMVGHLCSDINQGALSATLTFLVSQSGYSYLIATSLVFAANTASAIIQPLFGWLGDRRPRPWLMAAGIALAGIGMCLIGFAPTYPLVVASAMLSGVGVAMFHPEGGRLSNLAASESKGEAMSIFAVGGNIGFLVGPLVVAAALPAFGMHGTLVFLVPSLLCAAVLLAFERRFESLGVAQKRPREAKVGSQGDHWGLFALVMGVLSLRSIMNYGLNAFIPLFLVGILGQTDSFAAAVISLFAVAGAVATVASGRAGKCVGALRLTVACMAVAGLAVVGFSLSRILALSLALVVVLSVANSLYNPAVIALGLEYLPSHLGMASGLSFGVAVAVGGIMNPVLGFAGDALGLVPVMLLFAGLSVGSAALALALGARLRALGVVTEMLECGQHTRVNRVGARPLRPVAVCIDRHERHLNQSLEETQDAPAE